MQTRGDDGDIFEFKSEGEYMPEQGDHKGELQCMNSA